MRLHGPRTPLNPQSLFRSTRKMLNRLKSFTRGKFCKRYDKRCEVNLQKHPGFPGNPVTNFIDDLLNVIQDRINFFGTSALQDKFSVFVKEANAVKALFQDRQLRHVRIEITPLLRLLENHKWLFEEWTGIWTDAFKNEYSRLLLIIVAVWGNSRRIPR